MLASFFSLSIATHTSCQPTNHLDMETIDVMIEAVQSFGGAVVVVSHDQFFLEHVGKQFWALKDGRLKTFQALETAKRFCYKSNS